MAARFGAKIVPFGSVGEDDLGQVVFIMKGFNFGSCNSHLEFLIVLWTLDKTGVRSIALGQYLLPFFYQFFEKVTVFPLILEESNWNYQ